MSEKINLILLYAFQSPKKDWTCLHFAQSVDSEYEKGMKTLEMWYPTKSIMKQIPADAYGSEVVATVKYERRENNLTNVTTIVSSFNYDGIDYTLSN